MLLNCSVFRYWHILRCFYCIILYSFLLEVCGLCICVLGIITVSLITLLLIIVFFVINSLTSVYCPLLLCCCSFYSCGSMIHFVHVMALFTCTCFSLLFRCTLFSCFLVPVYLLLPCVLFFVSGIVVFLCRRFGCVNFATEFIS
jgi:hypothetical protein